MSGWRDVVWGCVFTVIGFVTLGMTPIVNPLPFLIVGWTSLIVGAVLVCRRLVDRVES